MIWASRRKSRAGREAKRHEGAGCGQQKKGGVVARGAAAGVVLMLLPGGKQTQSAQAETDTRGTYSLEETERRMETLLGKISGTGQLSLMLTVQSGAELELAEDTDADERGQRRER